MKYTSMSCPLDGDSVDVKASVPSNSTGASSAGASKKASRMMHAKEGSDRVKVEGLASSEGIREDVVSQVVVLYEIRTVLLCGILERVLTLLISSKFDMVIFLYF